MAEQREIYRVFNTQDLPDMERQLNSQFSRLADRLDQMEGYRGSPSFQSNVSMNGNKITGLPVEPDDDQDAASKKYTDSIKLPVGFVVILSTADDPADLLGYGTWEQIAEGQVLVGYSSGDSDFGTLEGTGGVKTHTHSINPKPTTSGVPSATVAVQSGSGTTVATGTHTHSTDIAAFNSAAGDNLPPFYVVNIWKRTA